MKFYLAGINAKYIHTSLAIRTISSYCKVHYNLSLTLGEFTINQREEEILQELYFADADVYLFSCYIWNIEMVKKVASQISKLRPNAPIFFGGPEATYKATELMEELPFLYGVILGEGEEAMAELLHALEKKIPLHTVAGLCLRNGKTTPRQPIDVDMIPFTYQNLASLDGRILYYESMRGCPFTCSYCLSSVEASVRMKSLDNVKSDLLQFLEAKPRQVKFVDRTFNCNLKRANAIWKFLIDHDNGVTNFHFEISGDLLDQESLDLLATARPHLFQFEVGVQSTNPETLKAITRQTNLEKLAHNVKAIQSKNNIHLHLDLIAGLPYEDLSSFIRSFHWVHDLEPEQLQLGFLKVLGGSQMEAQAEEFGLVYGDFAPFQVLRTNWLSYEDIILLQGVESMVDTYRNSNRFTHITNALLKHFEEPFQFYYKLSQHYKKMKGEGPLSKIGYYNILGSFATSENMSHTEELKALCRYDIMLHEKPKKYPEWAQKNISGAERNWMREFYHNPENIEKYLPEYVGQDPKQISRTTHLELFAFHPETREILPTAILFDYQNRDITGNATTTILPFSSLS